MGTTLKNLIVRARAHGRAVKLSFAAMLGVLFLAGSMGAASASTTGGDSDLTGGAGDTFFTTITSYFKEHVISSVLILLALVVGVGMLIAWGKKAAKAK